MRHLWAVATEVDIREHSRADDAISEVEDDFPPKADQPLVGIGETAEDIAATEGMTVPAAILTAGQADLAAGTAVMKDFPPKADKPLAGIGLRGGILVRTPARTASRRTLTAHRDRTWCVGYDAGRTWIFTPQIYPK